MHNPIQRFWWHRKFLLHSALRYDCCTWSNTKCALWKFHSHLLYTSLKHLRKKKTSLNDTSKKRTILGFTTLIICFTLMYTHVCELAISTNRAGSNAFLIQPAARGISWKCTQRGIKGKQRKRFFHPMSWLQLRPCGLIIQSRRLHGARVHKHA